MNNVEFSTIIHQMEEIILKDGTLDTGAKTYEEPI